MQVDSSGDSLHEKGNPVLWERKDINLLSTDFAQRVLTVKDIL